jgi:vitamin B12 transporter
MQKFRLSSLYLALLTTPAFSATAPSSSTEELIVTGSYSPVTNEQLSSSVSVINQEQLLQLSSTSLIDALRQLPSVWVEQQGGPGGITSINLRGAEANHTLVLLDGVQLNDPTNTRGGAFDLNAINLESIERIEVIRGAQSAIYGSDALAGVIHIITKSPDKLATSINASVGEYDYATAGVHTRFKNKAVGYAIGLQVKDAGEPVPGSTAENVEFTSHLDWGWNNNTMKLGYRYFDGERTSFPEQSGGPEFAVDRNLDHSDYTDEQLALEWRLQATAWWQSYTRVSRYEREEEYQSPGISPYDAVPPNGANTDFDRTSFIWVNTLGEQQKFWGNVGFETRDEHGDSQGYLDLGFLLPTDYSLKQKIHSGFVNLNAYLIESLLLQASVRRDDADGDAAENSGHVGGRYSLSENWAWFANWGEGFKLPSFFALGHPLVGNPNLRPETVETRDTGFDYSRNQVSVRLTYFKHQFRDLIDFDSETFSNVNRDRVDTSGAEFEMDWQVRENFGLRVHGTYTDIDMLSSDTTLLGRPQSTYGTSVHYKLDEKWKFNASVSRVDERLAVSRHTGADVQQVLDAYNRLDASATWQLVPKLQLGLALENLTDEVYYTDIGFPAVGRTAKLDLRFDI